MALLEYELTVDENGNSKVTCSVLEVDKNDRIRFKSNNAKSAIVYQKGSPFNDPKGPKAGVPFPVGKKATPAFKVAKVLNSQQRLHFDCGVLRKNSSSTVKATPDGFQPWGGGDGTPPGRNINNGG
ncbi:MAG TPA: hypothetical protein VKV74_14360 [Bryobacteraceae bacterium]|nr:hypothetical protein [Bryobacteraceae bacterium]